MKSKKLWLALMLSALSLFVGCGGSGGGDSGGGNTGTLALSLTDAASEDYKAVYVTIEKVEVHKPGTGDEDGNWVTVSEVGNKKTYNLLSLVNGVREELGITELADDHYTQMRLILARTPDNGINILSQPHPHANYVVIDTDPDTDTDPIEIHELKVPSGFQTGIKIVGGFEIVAGRATEVILDFVVSKSIVKAGSSGNWLLKPTIKVSVLEEHMIVRGKVTDGAGIGIDGALVSAQQQNSDGNPVVFTSTVTAGGGSFALFVNPDPIEPDPAFTNRYNIVAYRTSYKANCAEVDTTGGVEQQPGQMLILLANPNPTGAGPQTGTLAGKVNIGNPANDQHVTLSFRQMIGCTSATNPGATTEHYVEVKSNNFVSGESYKTDLTVGDYDVNASIYDEGTGKQVEDTIAREITEGETTALDIVIPFPKFP